MEKKPIHPGVTLSEKLEKYDMSRKELAQRTNVTEKHICTVINGERGISAAFAQKLGYVFESADFWLNLQAKYESDELRYKELNDITEEEIALLKPLHEIVSYFIERGYMHNNCSPAEKIVQLRNHLKISNLLHIPNVTYNAAYRAQISNNANVNPYVLFAWQTLCEKETENFTVPCMLDKELLRANLNTIKQLMFGAINDGIEKLQEVLAHCGIVFQVVKNFRGAPVQGFIKERADKNLLLCLTIRGKRADTFWFTLFHEIAHVLNGDYSARFVDFDSVPSDMETKADAFARDTLIDPQLYRDFVKDNEPITPQRIKSLAKAAQVPPFIVIGRLQKEGQLSWAQYTKEIPKYVWVS